MTLSWLINLSSLSFLICEVQVPLIAPLPASQKLRGSVPLEVVDPGVQPLWPALMSLPRDHPDPSSPLRVSAFLSRPQSLEWFARARQSFSGLDWQL